MPRVKKQRLKRRKDGRYACRYKDQWFYGASEEEALALRDEYKRLEKQQTAAPITVKDYAGPFLERIKEGASDSTIYIRNLLMKKLTQAYGQKLLPEVTPSMMKELYSLKFAGLSQHYISHAKTLYVAFFDAAVDDQLIAVNPARAKSAKPHKGYSKSHRTITPQERSWIDNLCLDHPSGLSSSRCSMPVCVPRKPRPWTSTGISAWKSWRSALIRPSTTLEKASAITSSIPI